MNDQNRRPSTASYATLRIALFSCIVAAIAVVLLFLDSHYVCYNDTVYEKDTLSLDLRGEQTVDVSRLSLMKSLEFIDLRDSGLTVEQADELREKLPECKLLWSVPIAGEHFSSDSEEIDLKNPTEDDFDLLRFFDDLKQVNVTNCQLYELMMERNKEMERCRIIWTVPLGEKEYKSNTDSLVLPQATAEDIDRLRYMPQLLSVDFSGSAEYESIIRYAEENPACAVTWSVDVAGTTISSEAAEADISGTKIDDVAQVEKKLAYLPKLKKLIMCDCGLSNEVLDEFNKRQENVKIVWRVYFGRWSLRTDATAFSTQNPDPPAYRMPDDQVTVLKYCTDLEMLDLGHNALTSVEPFADLTNLKVLILADNRISDISPLYKLTKMEYFEMFINRISDISVVENMPNLTDVNFCWNRVSDPSPLYAHQHLERVWMCGGAMSAQTKRNFMAALPGVEFDLYSTYGSTNGSWRTNEHFAKIRDGFRNHNGMNDYHW